MLEKFRGNIVSQNYFLDLLNKETFLVEARCVKTFFAEECF